MSNVDETNDSKNINVILTALANPACTPEDARTYTRVVARYLESQLVGLSDVASHFVDAVTVGR
jgi:hypothetical protein